MGPFFRPNVLIQRTRSGPLQCRVRTLVLEQAFVAQPGSEKRGRAATMESIAGSAGRACAAGALGMRISMGDGMKT